MSEIHGSQQGVSCQPQRNESQPEASSSVAASAKTKPMFNVFGAKPVIDAATGDFENRFPAMRVIASCIRSLTAGLSSVGSAIKDVVWSTYSKLKFSVAQLSVNSTNIAAIKTLYGEEMASTYTQAFLEHGEVKQESSEQIESDFEKLSPQKETITLLSKGVISMSEIGLYVNPDEMAPDAVFPKGGFARIYGTKECLAMVDTLLYGEPGTLRSNIKGAMNLAINDISAAECKLKSLQSSPAGAPEAEIKAATENLDKATATLTDLKAQTYGYKSWKPEKLLTYKRYPEASTISKTATQAVQTASATLEQLQGAMPASDSKAIKIAEAKLKCAKENETDLQHVETWSPDKLLAYQAIQNQKLNRISLKVNGTDIDITSEFNTPTKNLNIFKDSIRNLTGQEPSDCQVCEMISLLDENGSIAGMASGGNSVTGFALGRALGRTGDADRDVINITLSPENSKLHFNYTSPQTYLNGITIPGANGGATSVPLSQIPTAPDEHGSVSAMAIDRVLTDLLQFKPSQKYTYTYTISETPGLKNNLALLDSRMACLPVTLIPSKIQNQFANALNDVALSKQENSANRKHIWKRLEGEVDPPNISEQFFIDVDRTNYSLLSEGKSKPLFDRIAEGEPEDQIETKKSTAINDFVTFVGNQDQALAISTIANQQVAFPLLKELMITSNGPLQLPNYGGGDPLGATKIYYTFSKSLEGKVVLYCKVQQTASMFQLANESRCISLDPKKSFATFDYALTFSFDQSNKMTITPSSIKYDYHFEELHSTGDAESTRGAGIFS